MRRLVILLAIFSFATVPQVFAQSEDRGEFQIIQAVWVSSEACNEQIATHVSLKKILSDPSAFEGMCVETEAYVSGRAAFLSKRDTRQKYSNSNDTLAERRLGIYGSNDVMDTLPHRTKRIGLIGKVGHCGQLYGENTAMMFGYCHYTDGPIILLSEPD